VSKWYTTGGRWEWRPCIVLSYENAREQFLIQWDLNNKQKYVSRLNLRFNDENTHSFALRLQAAHLQRLACEARVARSIRVDMLDVSVTSDPLPEDVDKIINKIGKHGIDIINSQIVQDIHSVDDLRKEIVQFWKRMNMFIGYEERHPLVDEVPDPVKPMIAPPMFLAPDKGN
jgi:hypothetical protein